MRQDVELVLLDCHAHALADAAGLHLLGIVGQWRRDRAVQAGTWCSLAYRGRSRHQVGLDAARAQHRDTDAVRQQLRAQCFGQAHHRELRRGIDGQSCWCQERGHGRRVDHVAPATGGLHAGYESPHTVVHAAHVDVEQQLPQAFGDVREFEVLVERNASLPDARVVAQDAHGPEGFFNALRRLFPGLRLRDIHLHGQDLCAAGGQLLLGPVEGVGIDIRNRDAHALGGQGFGDTQADAARSAGDERGLVPNVVHGVPPAWVVGWRQCNAALSAGNFTCRPVKECGGLPATRSDQQKASSVFWKITDVIQPARFAGCRWLRTEPATRRWRVCCRLRSVASVCASQFSASSPTPASVSRIPATVSGRSPSPVRIRKWLTGSTTSGEPMEIRAEKEAGM